LISILKQPHQYHPCQPIDGRTGFFHALTTPSKSKTANFNLDNFIIEY